MVDTDTKTGKAAFAAALAAVVIGASVLSGWLFEVEFLKRIAPGLVAMNPASAVAFILAGASLALFLRSPHGKDRKSLALIFTARLCALVVALIGLAKLVGVLSGWDFGVDQWLFASKLPDGLQFQNRMASNTALNFLLLGSALLLVDVKNRSVRFCVEFSVVVVGFGSLLAILGHVYNVQSFYRLGDSIPMALNTVITFSMLSVAFLLSHTDGGLLAVFAGDSGGGTMARRLLPAAILVPAGLGWLTLQGEQAGIYSGEIGEAVFAVANILVFTFLVCWSAKGLFNAELERRKTNEALQAENAERKRAEATLRESDEKFHQLADNITDSFWIRSPDLREVHYISPAFERIWGRSLKSLYANPNQWADFILPEDRERALAAFAALTGDTPSLDIEYRIVRPGGEIRWVHVRGFQVRDAANELIRLTGIVTDITGRKQAEEELNGKTALLEAQVNSSLDGILVIDQQGNKSLQNRRFVDLLKIPPHIADEKTDENRLQWVTDMTKDPEQFAEKVRYLYGHPAETSRDEMELKNGTVLDRYSSPVIGKDGRYYGRIWTFRDITERKRLEAQLLQSQKMETVGKLAGGVAHEFNSILTAIIGQSELLLGDLPAGSPLAKNATEISNAAGRAATLTRQLLAYGRKQLLQPETLDLNQVIAGMEGMFHHLMGGDVDTQIVPAPGLQAVKADAGQIEQVIMNMAINAREAMPNGGKLTLETANVSFDQESVGRYPELKPGDYVMLAITDTGTGMSEEVKARVFEPFFSTKGVGQGTGLGLSTCYGIIKQSGGHISIYSELDRGTIFKIYLPQVELQTKIPIQRLDSPDLPRGTETILLVEDDPALLEMAATLLRRLDYTVLAAANGIEALSLKQRRDIGHIDLLFTDVVMPHMNGKELADRVRALYPHTRILFTSAYTENAIVHQGVLDKGVSLLQKPFTPSALAHKLREVLDQPIAPGPEIAQEKLGLTKIADRVYTS
jgi:PAS domain S-box-containing protein